MLEAFEEDRESDRGSGRALAHLPMTNYVCVPVPYSPSRSLPSAGASGAWDRLDKRDDGLSVLCRGL